MAKEIEKKYLVKKELWQPKDEGVCIRQGYLSSLKERVVRVRIRGTKGFLTVKGANHGIERLEFEYEIPLADAQAMLELCEQPLIEKTRYHEVIERHLWEIDCFFGMNDGLMVAEIELPTAEAHFKLPEWAGTEVSGDERYYNSNLIAQPYSVWKKEEK